MVMADGFRGYGRWISSRGLLLRQTIEMVDDTACIEWLNEKRLPFISTRPASEKEKMNPKPLSEQEHVQEM